jgi:tryptophan-rich sensory protein
MNVSKFICILFSGDRMKKLIIFIVVLLAFVLPGFLFQTDTSYYQSLNLPAFAPPPQLFSIWFILYILIAYVVSTVYTDYGDEDLKDFTTVLIVNFILNVLFTPLFFGLKSPFLGFAVTLSVFITSIFLFLETRKLDKNLSLFLIPYILWAAFATILSLSILILN